MLLLSFSVLARSIQVGNFDSQPDQVPRACVLVTICNGTDCLLPLCECDLRSRIVTAQNKPRMPYLSYVHTESKRIDSFRRRFSTRLLSSGCIVPEPCRSAVAYLKENSGGNFPKESDEKFGGNMIYSHMSRRTAAVDIINRYKSICQSCCQVYHSSLRMRNVFFSAELQRNQLVRLHHVAGFRRLKKRRLDEGEELEGKCRKGKEVRRK